MTKTHTPLIIEGKIYVVVDIPEPPRYEKGFHIEWHKERAEQLAACTKYETLPEHAPYWEERIGQRVDIDLKHFYGTEFAYKGTYAIPPQQNQGDEWDDADTKASEFASRTYSLKDNPARWSAQYTIYLRNNYSITKK